MKKFFKFLRLILLVALITSFIPKEYGSHAAKDPAYYVLRIYHYNDDRQETIIDNYLRDHLVPSLHADRIKNIGVFKWIGNDTAVSKRMYVFIPFSSLKQWQKFLSRNNRQEEKMISQYHDAVYDKPAFNRIETIFLKAFKYSLPPVAPKLNSPKGQRVYELRSYESATEKIHENKVHMFNEGGEIDIFSRLGFNAVFYAQVIFGSKMPNLMYMTAFENMEARNVHWKAFGNDTAWKTLRAKNEYQHNVSKNEIIFLRPAEYSDL